MFTSGVLEFGDKIVPDDDAKNHKFFAADKRKVRSELIKLLNGAIHDN